MPRLAGFSAAVAVLAAITLLPKILLADAAAVPDQRAFHVQVTQAMVARGFTATSLEDPLSGHVRLQRGECVAMVASLQPDGTTRARLDHEAGDLAPGRIAYGGEWRDTMPTPAPQVIERIQRAVHPLGLTYAREPVLWIAQSKACAVEPGDFAGLAIHARPHDAHKKPRR